MKTALLFAALVASTVQAGWFGPSTYEECVQEHLKDAHSDTAARLVAITCRKQFPKTEEELKDEAVMREIRKNDPFAQPHIDWHHPVTR